MIFMKTKTQRKKQNPERPTLNPALTDFWITPARNRILYGGRASSKSWDAAAFAIYLAQEYSIKVLCARQFQNKIEESVYTLLKQQIHRFDLQDRFQILNNKIINPYTESEFIFYGLWRNIDEIKSLEGVDVCWLEEAEKLTPNQWEVLEPTIRKEGSQFWIIFNPKVSTDFIYQRFVINTPPDTITRQINYTENPWLSNTILKTIEALKEEDEEEYNHIYLGVPYDDDDYVIIKRKWCNAAIDAHLKLRFSPEGMHRIGYDIADDGGDRCCNVFAHGNVAYHMEHWKANEDELMKSCKRTYNNAMETESLVTYDATGIGAMAGSKFQEINEERLEEDPKAFHVEYEKFVAGGEVLNPDKEYSPKRLNKDMFSNFKAQSWWHVADRLRNTWDAVTNGTEYDPDDLISISSNIDDIEKLITELSTPKKDYDNRSKVKVESKKDLLDREIPSPDLADAFVMAFCPREFVDKGFFDVLSDLEDENVYY